ncbi:conserved membrane hypothetical protein [uncultured spirochete]|uniref:EF-hand domain-containing protein n=1 Tax=uncultured spirochete TaxID=156406 RepID=A0A3P3XSL2_9SPIR|nr:conserved membrane hypothetical protein [uncultured spirochete]
MADKMHVWRFRRIGGMDQVVLKTGEDIAALSELDPKLWAALAMPTSQHRCKEALSLLDEDHDGRVRVPEILHAVEKFRMAFTTLDILFDENSAISLDRLKDGHLREACVNAAHIAGAEVEGVDAAVVEKAISLYNERTFNGDGVVVPESAKDPHTAGIIETLIASGYQAIDSSGKNGVDNVALDAFAHDANIVLEWNAKGESIRRTLPDLPFDAILPAFRTISDVMDDYFRRCAVLDLAGTPDALKNLETQMAAALSTPLGNNAEALQALPLALPRADGLLALDAAYNPLYETEVKSFLDAVKTPYGLEKELDKTAWSRIAADCRMYAAWTDSKPPVGAESIDPSMLSDILNGGSLDAIRTLITRDLAEAAHAEALHELHNILVLKKDLLKILRNFVTMDEFYGSREGIFQSGRLFIDGRELELCLDVRNSTAHSSMAGLAGMYLIYCDITRTTGEKGSVVAALTAGDADRIYVGRNGIYFDNDGLDWNATITKVVIQPISIREAFLSPYKWLARTIEEFTAKRAGTAEAGRQSQLKEFAQKAVEQPTKAPQAAEQIAPKKIDVGTVAAIGVALGSIGVMITSILSLFIGMGVWMPIGILVVFLLISGPSMILAAIKLRKRDLSPILNAEGWAINGRLKLNLIFGAALSHLGNLPPNSIRMLNDPYAPKKKPWALYIVILIIVVAVVAWLSGWLDPVFAWLKG